MEHIVLSVPHTGSRTLQAILNCGREHTTERMDKLHRVAATWHCVVPLRDPIEVWRSWKSRGQQITTMCHAWVQLFELAEHYDFTYIPVDLPGIRDTQLATLGKTYDWSVKHGHGEGSGSTGNPPKFVESLYNHPLMEELYGATRITRPVHM